MHNPDKHKRRINIRHITKEEFITIQKLDEAHTKSKHRRASGTEGIFSQLIKYELISVSHKQLIISKTDILITSVI